MTSYLFTVILFVIFMSVRADDDDNDYSESDLGDTGAAVWALLTKEPGWTADTPEEAVSYVQPIPEPSKSVGVSFGGTKTVNANGLIKPQIEILKLVESFFRFKGEVASKVNAVVTDNWGLIKVLINTFMSKIGTLHAFTLKGIVVLRKILEFAAALFGQWEINVPSFNFGVSSSANAGLW